MLTTAISELLESLDAEFSPILSTQVSIPVYAAKILSSATIFSVVDGGRLIAFIAIYCNDSRALTAFMTMLAVARDRRHEGLASNLIKSSVDYLLKRRFERLRLEVYKSNLPAINLYAGLNFATVGETDKSFFMEVQLGRICLPVVTV